MSVPADRSWTATGLYLEPGTYSFAATGRWSSAGSSCGPAGDASGRHPLGSTSSRVVDRLQAALRRLLHNPEAGLLGARRETTRPWMSLVALVADEQTDASGATTHPDEKIFAGDSTEQTVLRQGYLYAYANDAFGFYGNNRGTVELTVTRQ